MLVLAFGVVLLAIGLSPLYVPPSICGSFEETSACSSTSSSLVPLLASTPFVGTGLIVVSLAGLLLTCRKGPTARDGTPG